MIKITSINNETVKETVKLLQRKNRESSGLFLIEGEKAINEALQYKIDVVKIFIETGHEYKFPDNIEIIETNEAVLKKISDTSSAPKIIAVAKQMKYSIQTFKKMNKVVLLEGIKDPGNLGTIIRSAVAFNIDGIVLYGDTVDLYNPKTVRSAVGNLWKIPVVTTKNINDIANIFSDFERVGTLPKSKQSIYLKDYKPAQQTVIMLGSEADGLSDDLKNFATKNITIEMNECVESLNLSISAAIIMYKLK